MYLNQFEPRTKIKKIPAQPNAGQHKTDRQRNFFSPTSPQRENFTANTQHDHNEHNTHALFRTEINPGTPAGCRMKLPLQSLSPTITNPRIHPSGQTRPPPSAQSALRAGLRCPRAPSAQPTPHPNNILITKSTHYVRIDNYRKSRQRR